MNEPIEPGGQDAVLSEICRSAAYLMASAAQPLRRVSVRVGEVAVELEWPAEHATPAASPPAQAALPTPPAAAGVPPAEAEASGLHYVRADTVGTFFRAPEPGAEPFIAVGDDVTAGQQVAILEVMKMMTPIVADRPGRVVEIFPADGESVEFDARLLALEPAGM